MIGKNNCNNDYKKILSKKYLNGNKAFLYWKGRVALYALLKAMGVGPGDEVILPAYTCVVVPNAIMYLGAKPVYVDVREDSLNMDVSKVEAALTEKSRVIICQNTFGLSTDLEALNDIAGTHNLLTIEDCTHGFGGMYNGRPNGSFCDAAFFSTQWNKPFSTGIGGFASVRSRELAEKMQQLEKEKLKPSPTDLLNLQLLYRIRRYCLNDRTYWTLLRLYRVLSRYNLVVGSSSGEELTAEIQMPAAYFKDFSPVQAKEGLRNLRGLADTLRQRKENALLYNNLLKSRGKHHVPDRYIENHAFLKYPLWVKDKKLFFALAEKFRIQLGDWFVSPLHPIEGDLTPWGFVEENFSVAARLCRHVLNLPTTPKDVNKVASFLEKYLDQLL